MTIASTQQHMLSHCDISLPSPIIMSRSFHKAIYQEVKEDFSSDDGKHLDYPWQTSHKSRYRKLLSILKLDPARRSENKPQRRPLLSHPIIKILNLILFITYIISLPSSIHHVRSIEINANNRLTRLTSTSCMDLILQCPNPTSKTQHNSNLTHILPLISDHPP